VGYFVGPMVAGVLVATWGPALATAVFALMALGSATLTWELGLAALSKLKAVALRGDNLFAGLLEATEHCSLGQITDALYEVGGEYRRNV